MFFIGGIFQGKKEFEHFRQTIVCKKCGRLCSISVFMTYTCFSFFFIPLFKWGKQYYAVSNCCHTIYAIDAELGKAIEHGESVTLRKYIAPTAAICFRRNTPIARNAAEKFIKASEKQWLCQRKTNHCFLFFMLFILCSLFFLVLFL